MESESELKWNEMERDNLQKTISDVEAARAASTPGTRPFFENVLLGARMRLGAIEKKIQEGEKELAAHAREEVVAVYSAQKEAALNAREQETFGGFLKKEFFTKKDFGSLAQFYAHSWDRVSEYGKDEMSKRVWEGVRRKEYTFAELPEVVREKETKRAYQVLKERETGAGNATNIPEKDRSDFIRAFEAGNREDAEKILERESFKNGMFRNSESSSVHHAAASERRESESRALVQALKSDRNATFQSTASPEAVAMGQANMAALKLGGMTAAENAPAVSPPVVDASASIPRQR